MRLPCACHWTDDRPCTGEFVVEEWDGGRLKVSTTMLEMFLDYESIEILVGYLQSYLQQKEVKK
jgi:hypothetical protein